MFDKFAIKYSLNFKCIFQKCSYSLSPPSFNNACNWNLCYWYNFLVCMNKPYMRKNLMHALICKSSWMTAFFHFISEIMRRYSQNVIKGVFGRFLADLEKAEIWKFSVFSFSGGFPWGCSRSHYFSAEESRDLPQLCERHLRFGSFLLFFFALVFPWVLAFRLLLWSHAAQDSFEYFFPTLSLL